MLITTGNDLPGHVVEVLGEIFGITVRSRHIGSQIGAGFKSIFGGELKGMTKMLAESRHEAKERLVMEAEEKGADAILAMRFDTYEVGTPDRDLRLRHRRPRRPALRFERRDADGPPGDAGQGSSDELRSAPAVAEQLARAWRRCTRRRRRSPRR